jgi:hypothetical protein
LPTAGFVVPPPEELIVRVQIPPVLVGEAFLVDDWRKEYSAGFSVIIVAMMKTANSWLIQRELRNKCLR